MKALKYFYLQDSNEAGMERGSGIQLARIWNWTELNNLIELEQTCQSKRKTSNKLRWNVERFEKNLRWNLEFNKDQLARMLYWTELGGLGFIKNPGRNIASRKKLVRIKNEIIKIFGMLKGSGLKWEIKFEKYNLE